MRPQLECLCSPDQQKHCSSAKQRAGLLIRSMTSPVRLPRSGTAMLTRPSTTGTSSTILHPKSASGRLRGQVTGASKGARDDPGGPPGGRPCLQDMPPPHWHSPDTQKGSHWLLSHHLGENNCHLWQPLTETTSHKKKKRRTRLSSWEKTITHLPPAESVWL